MLQRLSSRSTGNRSRVAVVFCERRDLPPPSPPFPSQPSPSPGTTQCRVQTLTEARYAYVTVAGHSGEGLLRQHSRWCPPEAPAALPPYQVQHSSPIPSSKDDVQMRRLIVCLGIEPQSTQKLARSRKVRAEVNVTPCFSYACCDARSDSANKPC